MKISILMTSFNYANYIKEAIESVLAQTYTDWELIIVDDCSNDNSVDIIEKYLKDSRIKLIKNNKNLGLARSIKIGLKNCSSEWISFLESDDRFKETSIEEKVFTIKKYNPTLLFTDVEMFQDETCIKIMAKHIEDIKKDYSILNESGFVNNFSQIIKERNIIPTFSAVTVKKSFLEKCDFSSPYKAYVDYFIWNQLQNENVYYLNKKLTEWRMHSDSYINKDKHTWLSKYLFYTKLYYFTIKDKPLLQRIFLLLNYMRCRVFYLKIDKKSIKFNLASEKFIFERFWK